MREKEKREKGTDIRASVSTLPFSPHKECANSGISLAQQRPHGIVGEMLDILCSC